MMAYAPLIELDRLNVHGCFVEAAHGHYFEFARDQQGAPWAEYPDKVWVGPNQETRWAKVLKTVARIVVDEAADGSPVIEKWVLRKLSNRRKTS